MNRIDHPIVKVLFVASLAALVGGVGCQESEPRGYGSESIEGGRAVEPGLEPGLDERGRGLDLDAGGSLGADGAMLQNEVAIQQLAEARCQLAQRCGDIGADGDWASADACRQEILRDYRDELNSRDCPGGVDAKELDECLEEIGTQACDAPFDALGTLIACRTSDMCKAIP